MAKNWTNTEDQNAYRPNQLGFKTWVVGIVTVTFLRTALVAQKMVSVDKRAAFHLSLFFYGWLCKKLCVFSEKGRIVPKRSKRLRRKFTSEYANGEVSEDKNSWKNSSDDGKMKLSHCYQ